MANLISKNKQPVCLVCTHHHLHHYQHPKYNFSLEPVLYPAMMVAPNESSASEISGGSSSMDTAFGENCSYLMLHEHNITIDPDHLCFPFLQSILDAEESFEMFGPPWWCHLLVQVLYGIVCLIGLAGNTLVIYVVVRFSKMQTVTNLYIVNLAIADECFLIGIPFLVVTAVLGYWPFGNFVCKAYFTTTSINQITSSLFLLVMSADR